MDRRIKVNDSTKVEILANTVTVSSVDLAVTPAIVKRSQLQFTITGSVVVVTSSDDSKVPSVREASYEEEGLYRALLKLVGNDEFHSPEPSYLAHDRD